MKVLVRAIVTGFGLSVGSYVFKKLQQRYNLDPDQAPAPTPPPMTPGGEVARQPS